MTQPTGGLHHVELWVPDLARARTNWGGLLTALGWRLFQDWPAGSSWIHGDTYIVVEQSVALSGQTHDRMAPGLNHLAFHCASAAELDTLVVESAGYGWSPLFAEKYPHAGGPEQYAAYLTNQDGFEVEIVAADWPTQPPQQ